MQNKGGTNIKECQWSGCIWPGHRMQWSCHHLCTYLKKNRSLKVSNSSQLTSRLVSASVSKAACMPARGWCRIEWTYGTSFHGSLDLGHCFQRPPATKQWLLSSIHMILPEWQRRAFSGVLFPLQTVTSNFQTSNESNTCLVCGYYLHVFFVSFFAVGFM